MEKAKRIPYGVSDFVDIIERNQYYVDKTMYLPMIEDEADSLFFIRPRRFGKSLLISMMRAYYDQRMAPRVEALRQGTQLHKIIMQFEGWELRRMEEVE